MVVGANCSCFNYYAFWHIYYFSIPFHKLLVHGIYPFYRECYIYLVLLGWYNFCSESCHGWDFLNIGPNVLTDRFTTWRIYVNILAYCTVSYATFYFLFIRSSLLKCIVLSIMCDFVNFECRLPLLPLFTSMYFRQNLMS